VWNGTDIEEWKKYTEYRTQIKKIEGEEGRWV
jgi:hypothetical protein